MSPDSITLHGIQSDYQPGRPVSGAVEWSGNAAPRSIEVRLFWLTSGAAPRQIGTVETFTVRNPMPCGTSRFEFILPDGPWSYDGLLTRLSWAVEAVMKPSGQNTRVDFLLRPEGSPPLLYSVAEPPEE